ncbi:MAG: VanZ family protein [Bacteroidota bacterium]
MIIKTLSEPNKKSLWTAVIWTGLILFLSFKSPAGVPQINISNIDKVVHFMFYFVFVFLWYRFLFFKKLTQKKHLIVLVLIAISLGILVEFAQGYFTITRQPDFFDALANTIGSLFGFILANSILKKENT